MAETAEKLFYTPDEFRHILGCSKHICYEALRQNKIRNFRLGTKYFIPASEIDRLTRLATDNTGPSQLNDASTW